MALIATEHVVMPNPTFEPMTVPLHADAHGAIRIGETRVLLDLVVQEFRNGSSAEEIAESYGALDLADVYITIGYYLRHTNAIDAYVRRREVEAKAVREMIEAAQPPRPNLRAALLARANARERADVQAD